VPINLILFFPPHIPTSAVDDEKERKIDKEKKILWEIVLPSRSFFLIQQ